MSANGHVTDDMLRTATGAGGASSCGTCCPFDARFCVSWRDSNQCAIREEDVEAKCGAWDECGGVVCSPQYKGVCLARRTIDMHAFKPSMWVYAKPPNATRDSMTSAKSGPFVSGLRADPALSQYDLLDAEAGHWNGCSGPIFWIVLGGHFRTLEQHLPNARSFATASSPCSFVVLFLRSVLYIAGRHGAPRNQQVCGDAVSKGGAAVARAFGSNVAYAVTKRKGGWIWANIDTWWGGWALLRATAKVHRIRENGNDVVLFARPDLIFSHPLDVPRLSLQAQFGDFLFYAPHTALNVGSGNDPSELARHRPRHLVPVHPSCESVPRSCSLSSHWLLAL